VESFTLKDKSIVELQRGSKIVFDKDFNKKGRKLSLTGSGTFTVTHDEKSPFVLKVNKLEIHDIGTVFKVLSYSDTVKIIVYEGAVELRLNNQVINMVEGDSSFYLIEKQIISRYQQPSTRQDKIFKFDGTSLSEVARVLSGFFNQKIVISNKEIENCPLSVTFKNENLPTILDIIKELLDLEIIKRNNIIEIHGKGC
jgi:ferric-dicitrate binding protein FerR (iron transport regulator)